ncbi:DUF6339 family protein [Tomitella fengzijianii]|uniref:Uncharacterized protein n=1 Tax=Tomitella fengzijianii TaxID=2597660 RepID=A0A516X161_9ACTN|nr:DUF6339 family protein [Tomitella fengzijianii]QDQ96341.1 hypothetical protein FO059_01995 [Tomitella fengzijianii]
MSILYPRLLPNIAEARFEEIHGASLADLQKKASVQDDSAVYVATGGLRAGAEQLDSLRESVLRHAKNAGFPEPPKVQARESFDLAVARHLHRESGLAPAEAAAGGVWAFLALILLPDVLVWRFPEPVRDRALGTDLTRHVFGRLWWRAQLIHDSSADDPYADLGRIGGEAFGQIYERRNSIGASPALVRAIITVWNEVEAQRRNRDVFRDFMKRVLRLGWFMRFETLEQTQLQALLRRTIGETLSAVGV